MGREELKPGDRVRLFRTYEPSDKFIWTSLRNYVDRIATVVRAGPHYSNTGRYVIVFDDDDLELIASGGVLKKVD